ncbi:FAD-dependent oxidoreductase [Arthrobacter sp. B1I2]|uniref:FAD-dependent oxidoreductase n=1 Tax=Arthrobacter sp. B1I2 TaxID=3042263 RepID=UPI0027884082|nr:FAD-dependent oxidoreductase [Arthrobacter sp. B1I2]MDQ0733492.1 D-amino-acid oxidase [Arthrobacter sp. B1I2]
MSKVTVIGGGVTGLTTAIRLREAGHEVTVAAKDYLAGTTSWVATAIWHLFWVEVDERVERWSVTALDELIRLSRIEETGVTLVRGIECVRETSPDAEDFVQGRTGAAWQHIVPSYEALTLEELKGRLPWDYPLETMLGGYIIEVPIADMSVYLPYLMKRLEHLGVRLESDTFENFSEVEERFPADWYINCTGLGSATLAGDSTLRGIKGQIVRVTHDGSITEYIADDFSPRGMTYILPRGQDIVLGGSEDTDCDDSNIDDQLAASILARCAALVPDIANATVLEHLAGLRPYRPSIRLEFDPDVSNLIHNYGHGGSGVSLSWGCSAEVVEMVGKAENGQSTH